MSLVYFCLPSEVKQSYPHPIILTCYILAPLLHLDQFFQQSTQNQSNIEFKIVSYDLTNKAHVWESDC